MERDSPVIRHPPNLTSGIRRTLPEDAHLLRTKRESVRRDVGNGARRVRSAAAARAPARQSIQSKQSRQARYAAAKPTVIRTGYTSREGLTIYADGFLKGQAVAAALIGERLTNLGFAGMNDLVVDRLESRRFRFHSKDDDAESASASCPFCGRGTLPQ